MTDANTTTSVRTWRHTWIEGRSFAASETESNCDETEYGCAECGLIKIHVHPPHGYPYRMWRRRPDDKRFGGARPNCIPKKITEAQS